MRTKKIDSLRFARPQVRGYDEFAPALSKIKGRVQIEKGSCSMAISDGLREAGCDIVETDHASEINRMKAVKNEVEIKNLIRESDKDSAALVMFLAWLNEQLVEEEGSEVLGEWALAEKLKTFRNLFEGYKYDSFDCISSVGANAAIIHYKPEKGKDVVLSTRDVYLLDSGAQWEAGTTDVTRTIHFGTASDYQRRMYTRVLQGHVNLAAAIFPNKTSGLVLDCLARSPLWAEQKDYGHGTGHGIGASLNVHEGPFGIGGSSRPGDFIRRHARLQDVYLEPIVAGYYCSNEPGYYEEGEFGIRIESDMVTERCENEEFLKFNYVTKVPFCQSLLMVELLGEDQKRWIDEYHRNCLDVLVPLLEVMGDERALVWLRKECAECVQQI